MKYISTLFIFTCCFFKTYNSVAQTDTTYHSPFQLDTTYYINEVKVRVFKSAGIDCLVDGIFVRQGSVTFCHYDSLNRLRKDSAIYDKWGFTSHYHYVDEKIEVKYTYYHDKDINVFRTEFQNDSVTVFNTTRFKDNDTVIQHDTIFLYYPYSGTVEYYDNNLTMEALNERIYSTDTFDNRMRIFMVHFQDTTFSVVLYTISDIFKNSLQVTKKIGDYLFLSSFESKEDLIRKYSYESTHKTVSNEEINKTLKKITSLKSLPVRKVNPEIDFDNLLVEYVVNGKYYYFVSSYNFSYSSIREFPSKEQKVLDLIIKLVTYLDESFRE